MDEQTAKLVIAAGFAVGFVVWLVALNLYRRMADAPAVERLEARLPGQAPGDVVKALLAGLQPAGGAERLARPAETMLHITQGGVETRIEAQRAGGQTLVTAEVDDSGLRRKMQLALALFVVLLMPAAVVGIPAALWYFAAPSAAPGVRWQCVQVVQMVHVLWPPFLVYFLWKKQRDMAVASASNLLVRAAAA